MRRSAAADLEKADRDGGQRRLPAAPATSGKPAADTVRSTRPPTTACSGKRFPDVVVPRHRCRTPPKAPRAGWPGRWGGRVDGNRRARVRLSRPPRRGRAMYPAVASLGDEPAATTPPTRSLAAPRRRGVGLRYEPHKLFGRPRSEKPEYCSMAAAAPNRGAEAGELGRRPAGPRSSLQAPLCKVGETDAPPAPADRRRVKARPLLMLRLASPNTASAAFCTAALKRHILERMQNVL